MHFKNLTMKTVAAVAALAVIFACGGEGTTGASSFPLTKPLLIFYYHDDTSPGAIPIALYAEGLNNTRAPLNPGDRANRNSGSLTWKSATDEVSLIFVAQRQDNGVELDRDVLKLTGEEARFRSSIDVKWTGAGISFDTFPLTKHFTLSRTNNSADNVHLWLEPQTIGPNNRVDPGQTTTTQSPSYTWLTAGATNTLTFRAGRNGNPIGNPVVLTVTGTQASQIGRYSMVWNGTTLTVTSAAQ